MHPKLSEYARARKMFLVADQNHQGLWFYMFGASTTTANDCLSVADAVRQNFGSLLVVASFGSSDQWWVSTSLESFRLQIGQFIGCVFVAMDEFTVIWFATSTIFFVWRVRYACWWPVLSLANKPGRWAIELHCETCLKKLKIYVMKTSEKVNLYVSSKIPIHEWWHRRLGPTQNVQIYLHVSTNGRIAQIDKTQMLCTMLWRG